MARMRPLVGRYPFGGDEVPEGKVLVDKRELAELRESARLVLVWLGCENTPGVLLPDPGWPEEELNERCSLLREALKKMKA